MRIEIENEIEMNFSSTSLTSNMGLEKKRLGMKEMQV